MTLSESFFAIANRFNIESTNREWNLILCSERLLRDLFLLIELRLLKETFHIACIYRYSLIKLQQFFISLYCNRFQLQS